MKKLCAWSFAIVLASGVSAGAPAGDHASATGAATRAASAFSLGGFLGQFGHAAATPTVHPFCSDHPKNFICGGQDERARRVQDDLKIESFKEWIQDGVEDAVVEHYHLQHPDQIYDNIFPRRQGAGRELAGNHRPTTAPGWPTPPRWATVPARSTGPARRAGAGASLGSEGGGGINFSPPYRDYLLGVYGTIFNKLDISRSDFQRIKTTMLERLRKTDDIVDHDGQPDTLTISRMVGRVARTEFVTDIDGLSKALRSPEEFMTSFADACGLDGMSFNAFYFPPAEVVIPCPGFLASAVKPETVDRLIHEPDPQPNSSGDASEPPPRAPVNIGLLSFILGHELGHSIDSELFARSYRPFVDCLYQYYPKLPNGTTIGDIGLVKAYQAEMIADNYGSYTFAALLDNPAFVAAGGGDKFAILKGALRRFCDMPAESNTGGHPGGDYRMDSIVAQNPALRAALGPDCPPRPACTFKGYQRPAGPPAPAAHPIAAR